MKTMKSILVAMLFAGCQVQTEQPLHSKTQALTLVEPFIIRAFPDIYDEYSPYHATFRDDVWTVRSKRHPRTSKYIVAILRDSDEQMLEVRLEMPRRTTH